MSGDAQFTYVDEDPQHGELAHWERFATERPGGPRRRPTRGLELDRRRLIAIAAGALALLAVAVLLWRPWSGPDAAARALGGDNAAVLIQLRDEEGRAIANAVVMHDRAGSRGAVVGVPDDLAIDVPVLGVGSAGGPDDLVTVREALVVAGESLSRDALADVLGIAIDGSWVLEARTFATLVDRIGGIQIDSTRVDGDIALAQATSASETSTERAGRFAQVLTGVLAKIPQNFADAGQLLDALGLVGDDQLVAVLSGAAGDLADDALPNGVIPVQSSGLLAIDDAAPLVRDLLGPQLQARSADETPRVLVQIAQNTSPEEAAEIKEAARVAIVNAGYRFIDGGTVQQQATSSITTFGNSGIGEALAATLGLDQGAVAADSADGLTDAIVVLGADYQR